MEPKDLNDDDLVMLLALARHLSNLDDLVSLPELTAFRDLRSQLGVEAFRAAAARAAEEYPTTEGTLYGAVHVSDEARPVIRGMLEQLAASDGVIEVEQAMLDALEAVWAVRRPSA